MSEIWYNFAHMFWLYNSEFSPLRVISSACVFAYNLIESHSISLSPTPPLSHTHVHFSAELV